ncbi:hypothetical protein EIP91_012012 [Steccherinum ochraceum]|uniref:Uncharacterized protein n=1 Tax=Steccherinum ochraceum TaxID=92696 RepID=A0A4R0RNS6_9APHY|nr:hypothetical protein EIP91_012012 [Steccherinum ochraceum]
MDASQERLDALFPAPAPAPKGSSVTPTRLVGPDADSVDALVEVLQKNHKNLHIFFNDRHFHNHSTHHMLAIYALGAGPKLIKAAYASHEAYQRPAVSAPSPITKENWKEHLGDEAYYQSYLTFFSDLLLKDGPSAVFQQYVFSKDANFVPANGKSERPNMYNRLLGGLVHPMIHAGYGAEFGQMGMWAEGLSEACVEQPQPTALIPDSFFEELFASTPSIVSRLASIALSSSDKPRTQGKSTHALSILGRVASDPQFSPAAIGLTPESGFGGLAQVVKAVGPVLHKFLEEWTVGSTQAELDEKISELMWMNTVVYAVGGFGARKYASNQSKEFNSDFLLMHLVTSVLFVPSLASYLPHATAAFFVRTYFITSLALYIMRGRPALPVAEFFATTTSKPAPRGPQPTPSTEVFTRGLDTPESKANWLAGGAHTITTPNPWLPLIQSTMVHPDEHLCKLQRALMHFATLFGTVRKGAFARVAEGLEGAEELDGTLFVRAAGLTANRLGWVREGEAHQQWDFSGFIHAV